MLFIRNDTLTIEAIEGSDTLTIEAIEGSDTLAIEALKGSDTLTIEAIEGSDTLAIEALKLGQRLQFRHCAFPVGVTSSCVNRHTEEGTFRA